MKKRSFIITLTVLLGASMLSPSMAQSYYIEDDIYYTPGDENPIIEQKKREKEAATVTTTTVTTTTTTTTGAPAERDVDEYNRRGSYSTDDSYTDDNTVTGTTFTYQSDEVAPGDTVYIQPEEGYYLNDFNGSLNDYEYTIRIHRFYDPRYAINISDPAYTDIYFLDSNDWNVYIEGNYAWVTPTWTNPWYWNYMWAPYSYSSWAWRWNYGWTSWGFYDPWYYSYGWGYPYHGYYGWGYPYHGYYGWGYPYHGWGYPHGWHNDWYYTANGRGPRQWRNDTPARPGSSSNRYGGTYTAGARGNSMPSRREGVTTGTSTSNGTRGQRYTPSTGRDNIDSNGRRGTTIINSGRRGSTSISNGSTIDSGRRGVAGSSSVGTTTNRRPSTSISTTGRGSRSTSLRGGSTSTGRTTINTQGTSVSRPSSTTVRNYNTPSRSTSTRNSYSPSRGNTSRSSVGSSRGSMGSSRSGSMSSGGSRGRR